ncbi:MAG: hypothetical protein E7290_03635 [Lachnospiraceae bacterium]|nr:hypothetical protein [Lachnospiraceae bacterium]
MEYNSKHSGEEIIKNQEYIVESPEYISVQEVNGATEYHMADEYYSNQLVDDSCVTQEHLMFKVIRKMVYLVASAVACVTISQTISTEVAEEEIQDSMVKADEVWTLEDTGEDDDINDLRAMNDIIGESISVGEKSEIAEEHHENVITSEAVNEGIYPTGSVLVSCYEDIGNGNGGRMPYLQDGLWGVLDYEGNVILEPTYQGFWSAPNEDGYTIFYDDDYYYVTDRDGAEVLRLDTTAWNNVSIGPDNYILAQYIYPDNDSSNRYHYAYFDAEGTAIAEYEGVRDGYYYFAGNFNNGRAILPLQSELYAEYGCLGELDSDGNLSVLWEACTLIDEEDDSDGYMNGAGNSGGNCLVSFIFSPIDPVTEDGYYVAKSNYQPYGFINLDTGEEYIFSGPSYEITPVFYMKLRNYTKDGEIFYHYATYGCVAFCMSEEDAEQGITKDFLIDFTKQEEYEEMLTNYIACYDRIYFNDSKYLLVNDGGDIFYIDFNGNVVSEKLEDATSFTKDGYAMIIEDGNAYVIDENFTRLEKIEGVTAVSALGEILWYAKGEEEYSYYYSGQ